MMMMQRQGLGMSSDGHNEPDRPETYAL